MDNFLFQENLRDALTAETKYLVIADNYGAYLYHLLKMDASKPAEEKADIESKLPGFINAILSNFDNTMGIPPKILMDKAFTQVLNHSALSHVLQITGEHYVRATMGCLDLIIHMNHFSVSSPIKTVIFLRELHQLAVKFQKRKEDTARATAYISLNIIEVDGSTYFHVIDKTTNFLQVHDKEGKVLSYTDALMQVWRPNGDTRDLVGVWKFEDRHWVFHFQGSSETFKGFSTILDARLQSEYMLTPVLIKKKLIS